MTDEHRAILQEIKAMPDRGKIAHVLNRHLLTGAVAEIGVDRAHYAEGILANWKGQTYYAVDLWYKQDPAIYSESLDHETAYRFACGAAERDKRIKLMRMLSLDASKLIADNSLDWVWIDANHSTQAVSDDMDAWWPKVKTGGVFSGHDYFYSSVRSAVEKWFYEHPMEFVVVDSSWWTVRT